MIATWGGLSLPLDPADYTTSFVAADPLRSLMLRFFGTAITAELGDIWTTVSNTLPALHDLRGKAVVQDTLELAPSHEVMTQRKAGFPLLALHRVDTRTYAPRGEERTRSQDWHLHYILGPLEVGVARKLLDVTLIVEAIVDACITQQRHEAFDGGAIQFASDSPVNTITLTQAQGPGQALYGGDADSGTIYWGIVLTIATSETGTEYGEDGESGDPILDGTAFDVGMGGDGEVLPSIVLGDTDSIMDEDE